eukprot:4041356-Pyramimonas_sp.AAC.1
MVQSGCIFLWEAGKPKTQGLGDTHERILGWMRRGGPTGCFARSEGGPTRTYHCKRGGEHTYVCIDEILCIKRCVHI